MKEVLKLNYKSYGSSDRPAMIILHGLFGMLDNWQTLAMRWGADYCVYTLDLRNHGRSPHSENIDYYLMADDVHAFCQSHYLHDIILLGHSMGGKVAMQLATEYPSLVHRLVVVDIAPKTYPAGHDQILSAIESLPLDRIGSRKEAADYLAGFQLEESVAQFILKNLYRTDQGKYNWRMNFNVLKRHYDEILVNPLNPFLQFNEPTLFIKGGQSENYIRLQDTAMIQGYFSNSKIVTIQGAGHWVHAEEPELFYNTVNDFLRLNG